MFNYPLPDVAHSSFILPPQALPDKNKDEQWKKENMDALENIGLRQISNNYDRFERAYRIVEGDFRYADMTSSSMFLSEVQNWRSQVDLKDNIVHYGFIEPIINQIIGDFVTKPNPITVVANDEMSTNDFIRAKTDMLWQSTLSALEKEINHKIESKGLDPKKVDFQSEEEQQQYQQQIAQMKQEMTPPEIEKYMNQSWKAKYVEWAELTLEEDYTRFDIDEIDRECLYDFLVTGRCYRHHKVGYDYYFPERWSPKNTFSAVSTITRYVEKGDYVGRIHYYTPNELITRIGHKLSESQKRDITRSKYYSGTKGSGIQNTKQWIESGGGELRHIPFPSYINYANSKYLQESSGVDLGISELFPNGDKLFNMPDDYDYFRGDLIRVVEAYWVSQKRIGYLTLMSDSGNIITDIVTDEILKEYLKDEKIKQLRTVSLEQHEVNPKANTIVWDYVPEVWKGLKICHTNTDLEDDLYIDIEPLEYQLKGESQTYHTLLPVTGLVEKNSWVSKVYQYQVDYNIAMNMARDYMTKELGTFYVFDLTFMPSFIKDLGGTESMDKLFDIIKELGILPVDGTTSKSNFNQFTKVDMDLTQAMIGKVTYANLIKREAFSILGMTPERMGQPIESETATGVKASQHASYAQTETIFDKFSKHTKASTEVLLNIAQYTKKDGTDVTVNYTDSDSNRHLLKMNDPKLPLRRFRVLLDNSPKRRSELEILKQVYLNDNTVAKDLESIASVIASDSMSKIIQVSRAGRRIAEAQKEKEQIAAQRQLETKLQSEAIEQEKERAWKSRENELDRQMAIEKQTILALGFAKDQDINKNEVSDIVDQLKASTERLKVESDIKNKDLERKNLQLQKEKEISIKNRELEIKQQELAEKRHATNTSLQIARENKNKYDIKKK